jgi:MoxR-like ATPase
MTMSGKQYGGTMPDNNDNANFSSNTQPIQERIGRLMENLSKDIFEKEEARRLKYSFKNARVFEYLMSRFSTPDETFGPVSISRLKKEDKYERIIANYLPASGVVFLDEIWKAGPSVQNVLLTVINERVFRNRDSEIKIPLKALVSASNELPAKGQRLEALWGRFLVRLFVEGIRNVNSFNKMLAEDLDIYDDMVEESAKITEDEYRH